MINIKKPTLILDKERVLRNIEKMAHKAKNSGVKFRSFISCHLNSSNKGNLPGYSIQIA
jgi:D-serine deaminase-like pyridoxal phosphate-dependent protein